MADRAYLVLSAVGPDRPGLVAELTEAIASRGGNVEDSRMAVLGGSFGIMVLVSGDFAALAALQSDAAELERRCGLRLHLATTTPPHPRGGTTRFVIEAEAADREGIVHALADALYELGGNIVSLDSALYPAPVSGSPLFRLRLEVDVPEAAAARVEETVERVGREEDLDCTVQPAV
jgi:glycine cleavage system transcriptional repressor